MVGATEIVEPEGVFVVVLVGKIDDRKDVGELRGEFVGTKLMGFGIGKEDGLYEG